MDNLQFVPALFYVDRTPQLQIQTVNLEDRVRRGGCLLPSTCNKMNLWHLPGPVVWKMDKLFLGNQKANGTESTTRWF